jgi:hypothetical protein
MIRPFNDVFRMDSEGDKSDLSDDFPNGPNESKKKSQSW